jgi:uncharacterized protein (TIGR02611 family)
MLQRIKEHWHDLKRGRPGHRFQDHYHNRHESGGNKLRKTLFVGAGALLVAAGIFFLPAPGPGFVIIFLGGGVMAQESRTAARVLDWSELRVRRVADWALRVWRNASVPARAAIALFGLIVVAGAGFAAYQVLFGKP